MEENRKTPIVIKIKVLVKDQKSWRFNDKQTNKRIKPQTESTIFQRYI